MIAPEICSGRVRPDRHAVQPHEIADMRRRIAAGEGRRDIAAAVGRHYGTVWRYTWDIDAPRGGASREPGEAYMCRWLGLEASTVCGRGYPSDDSVGRDWTTTTCPRCRGRMYEVECEPVPDLHDRERYPMLPSWQ